MIVAAFLSCKFVLAQHSYSPYSSIGIGDLNDMSLSNNDAMGGIGIASPSVWHINNMNPALLVYNSFTVFEIGVEAENRTVSNDFNSVKVGSGGFKYLTFAFPIINGKWTSNIGLMPYSSVNYSFSAREDVPNTNVDAIINFEGSGGINQVYFSNGYRITKEFSAGLRLSYLFGLVESRNATYLEGEGIQQQFPTGVYEKTNFSTFDVGLGLSYSKKISDNDLLNFGAIYDLGGDMGGKRLERLEVESTTGATVQGDTLINSETGYYHLPSKLGLGFSWQKLNKLSIGLDVKRSFWNKSAGFTFDNSGIPSDSEEYRSTWSVALGFEIIPKYNDVNSYLKRIKYRIGLDFKQEPYVISGKSINNFGINFGWSLPVKGVSAVNMAFKYGQRGETEGTLVKEQYFKFVLGATINDRWFVRRKYN